MNDGWFAMSRKMFDHPIFAGHMDRVGVWAWMVATAAWKDTRQDASGKTVIVKRGQLLTSYRQMSRATGVGIQIIRTLLDRLQTEHAINTDTNTGRLLITIRNYDKYQSADGGGNTPKNTRATQEQHTKEQVNKDITLEANASNGADAPNLPAEFSVMGTVVWDVVPRFLRVHGIPDDRARPIVGKWLRDAESPARLLEAVSAAERARTKDPVPYITEALKQKPTVRSASDIYRDRKEGRI